MPDRLGQNGIMKFAFAAIGISVNAAGIDGKIITTNQAFFATAAHRRLKTTHEASYYHESGHDGSWRKWNAQAQARPSLSGRTNGKPD